MTNKPTWEEEIRMSARKSDKTMSGEEVFYDPNRLVIFIESILAEQRKEIIEKLENENLPPISYSLEKTSRIGRGYKSDCVDIEDVKVFKRRIINLIKQD